MLRAEEEEVDKEEEEEVEKVEEKEVEAEGAAVKCVPGFGNKTQGEKRE